MITAREPKQEDVETEPVDPRRGMRLVPGGRKVPKPLRIAIGNNVFSSGVATPVNGLDHPQPDQRPRSTYPRTRGTRAGVSGALVLALAVTASGLILNYVLGSRRKP